MNSLTDVALKIVASISLAALLSVVALSAVTNFGASTVAI